MIASLPVSPSSLAIMSAHSLVDHFLRLPRAGRFARFLSAVLFATVGAPLIAQPVVQQIDSSVRLQAQAKPLSLTAYDLYDVWQMGFSYSPYSKLALSRYAESQEERAISRAGLLPQISAGYSRSRIHGWRQQPNRFGQAARSDLRYDSTNLNLQLQQPLLNYARYAEYQRGKAVANYGQAQLAVDQQQISLEIAQGYFATLLAYENWQMQRERADFFTERVTTFEELLRGGQATQLDVTETAARLATAQADLLLAVDELRTRARQLESYIRVQPQYLRQLQDDWHYTPLTQDLQTLVETGLLRNRALQSAQQEVAIYQARLEAARSQYFPTVGLGITLAKADSEDLSTLSQRTNTFAIGINVVIPIFTGGYTTAATTQARYQLSAAQHRYNAVLAQTKAEIQKQYGLYTNGALRVAALKTAMESSQLSLDSVQKSFSVGAANNIEVLDAQDQLVQTRYDYYQARLDLLLAQLQLSAVLGEPLHQSIQTIAQQQFQGAAIRLPSPLRYEDEDARSWTLYKIQPEPSTHLTESQDQVLGSLDTTLIATD